MAELELTLIRHAKSSWRDPELSDHDRPLNGRGLRDAPRMGERLHERGFAPDTILTSSAERARITAETIAAACGLADRVYARRALYHAVPGVVMEVVASAAAAARLSHVAVVGHNPGLSDLVDWLTGEPIGHLPTCGVVTIAVTASGFDEVAAGSGRLTLLETPKNDPARD